jgi:hypothetical protein
MILGVALSSLLLQNALLLFLDMKVSGPEKDEVNSTRSLGRNIGVELRTGHPKSPPIRKGDCGSRTFLPGTGYRCLFVIFEGCLHHGSCSVPCHDFNYCSYPAAKTGTKEKMSIGGLSILKTVCYFIFVELKVLPRVSIMNLSSLQTLEDQDCNLSIFQSKEGSSKIKFNLKPR